MGLTVCVLLLIWFSQALGVTRQTINAIENDKYDPTLDLAMRLSRFLNTLVEDIFCLSEL